MLSSLLPAVVGALIFATAGVCGTLAAIAILPKLKRFDDGPAPVDVHPALLVAGAALLGAVLGWRRIPNPEFITAALATVPLIAVWYCDARTGIVPDLFTLLPLVLAIAYETYLHQPWAAVLSAAVLFAPFAVGALLSRGRGMGWGDAKLAAFGGALLGMRDALLAFGIASLAAVIAGAVRNRSKSVPIVFAPYLVAAIGIAIAVAAK